MRIHTDLGPEHCLNIVFYLGLGFLCLNLDLVGCFGLFSVPSSCSGTVMVECSAAYSSSPDALLPKSSHKLPWKQTKIYYMIIKAFLATLKSPKTAFKYESKISFLSSRQNTKIRNFAKFPINKFLREKLVKNKYLRNSKMLHSHVIKVFLKIVPNCWNFCQLM